MTTSKTSPIAANLKFYQPPDSDIYSGSRSDEEHGTRLCHVIECLNLSQQDKVTNVTQQLQSQKSSKKSMAILGFCSDEGVKRNHGRPGARKGPEAIRLGFKNTPLHYAQNDRLRVFDCGDIAIDTELEQGQEELASVTRGLSEMGFDMVFVLGGGHEVAWGHFRGIWQPEDAKATPSIKPPGVFNFDAHFDLRKMEHASSGTPFLQMYEWCQEHNQKFNYQVMGIQTNSNTKTLYDTAKKAQVKFLETEEVMSKDMSTVSSEFIQPFVAENDRLYVTICLDVFNGGCAPGVSAVNPFGLQPYHVIHSLRELIRSGKVKHIDIAEMNPKYDVQSLTSRLAATMVHVAMEELAKQAVATE